MDAKYSAAMGHHGDWFVYDADQTLLLSVYANSYPMLLLALARGWTASGKDVSALTRVDDRKGLEHVLCDDAEQALEADAALFDMMMGRYFVSTPWQASYAVKLEGGTLTFSTERAAPARIPIDDVPEVIASIRGAAARIPYVLGQMDLLLQAYVRTQSMSEGS